MDKFLEVVASVNGVINNAVWGLPGLILLIGTGILLTCGTKWFQVTHIAHWWKNTIASVFKKAATHIQNTAPGPPMTIAAATPAMLPVPIVAARAAQRA